MKTFHGQTFIVTRNENGSRLLDFLADGLNTPRRRAKALLDQRNLFVNGRRIWMARHRLATGDVIELTHSNPTPRAEAPPNILYRDDMLLVIDKPRGRYTVGTRSLETELRNTPAYASLCAVHRLDRDTTGCLLFAMTPAIKTRLIDQFRKRTVRKSYDTLVFGRVTFRHRTIRLPLDGHLAITHVHVLQTSDHATHLEVHIETGRTHQIRRHLAAIGHPLIGDKYYGAGIVCPPAMRDVARQMLHARRLRFRHPLTNACLAIEAPLPHDFNECLSRWWHDKKIKK